MADMNPTDLRSLAAHVAKLSKLLTRDRESLPVAYLRDPDLRTAYVRYFLPSNIKKVHLALTDLSLHPGWLLSKKKFRVLDIGAGPGTALLGLLSYFAHQAQGQTLACVAVDRVGESLRVAEELFNLYRTNKKLDASLKTVRADIESMDRLQEESFDIILFSNVLNELYPFDEDRIGRRIALVQAIAGLNLHKDGSCIIIEPALRETSRDLLELRDGLLQSGFSVFSPCLANTKCPARENPRDWCHEDIPWDPPELIREVDKLTGLRKDSLKFSYLVLRKDGLSLSDMFDPDSFRVVSEPLVTKGKTEFYLCGPPGRKLVIRLDKDRTPQNANFDYLKRGAIIGFDGLRDEGTRLKVEPKTEVVIHKHTE